VGLLVYRGAYMQPKADLRFTTSLKIVYALTLGAAAAWYLSFYLWYCLGSFGWTGDNVFSVFLVNLPYLFTMNAVPLAIFTLVFLTKGKGLDYLRSWNAGNKLLLSASTIVIGYLLVVFTPNTSAVSSHFANHYDYYVTYLGLALIAAGFVSMLLCKRQTSLDRGEPKQKIKWKSKKAVLIFSGILIFSIIIGGYHLKIHREHELIQEHYQLLKEGLPFLVNDEWTDNEGFNSNYITYKGAVFNSGLGKKYNVTLLVTIRDVDGVWLERAEIPIGDINGWGYRAFDVNIEYSGEMAEVITGYKWDDANSVNG
jgi:hypothetical protein